MIVVKQSDFIIRAIADDLRTSGVPPMGQPTTAAYRPPVLLQWELDQYLLTAIERASANVIALASTISLKALDFPHFGRTLCKRLKINPDFFVQMAIQVAYWRTHRTAVATYETAHTRLFYHGRTETIRTCSEDSVAFCKAMDAFTRTAAAGGVEDDPSQVDAPPLPGTDAWRYKLLLAAVSTHEGRVKDAMLGEGVDRHLLGLQIAAELEGMTPMPPLFTDPLFARSRRFALCEYQR